MKAEITGLPELPEPKQTEVGRLITMAIYAEGVNVNGVKVRFIDES